MTEKADTLLGQVVGGRYEIVRRIGKGGMGSIYEVRNTRLGRSFALKTLTGDAATNEEALARFRREADVVARLKHAHIVDVIDWETLPDGGPCMIMEYLEGEDLEQRIASESPLEWEFIARVVDQVLSALSVAHRHSIVHRDLKPQNIFLATDDAGEVERAKLLDFGVSKIRDSSRRTSDARLIGTPSYMSPEQAEGRSDDVGPQTDIWAMGAILYEMVTGTVAFEADGVPQTLYKICSVDPAPIENLRPDAPPELIAVIAHALQRDVKDRTANVDVLRRELRAALREYSGRMPELLQTNPRRTPPAGTPAADRVASIRDPGGHGERPAATPKVTTLSSMASSTMSGRLRSGGSWRWIAAGLVAAAVLAVALGVAMSGRAERPATGSAAPTATAVDPAPTVPAATPVEPAPTAVEVERVQLELLSIPAGAEVYRDDIRVGTTPYRGSVDKGSSARLYVLKLDGYVEQRVELTPDDDRTLEIKLVRVQTKATPKSTPKVPCRKKGEPVDPFNKKPPCPR